MMPGDKRTVPLVKKSVRTFNMRTLFISLQYIN